MGRLSKVEISGVNTSKLPVLTRDEAKALFLRVREGDEEARQTLIQGNLRLVLSVIKKFDGRNESQRRIMSTNIRMQMRMRLYRLRILELTLIRIWQISMILRKLQLLM